MSAGTKIEWTEVTWSPTTGCDRISPGCDNCYALRLAGRLKAMGQAKYQTDGDPRTSGPGFGVALHEDVLLEPLRWRRRRVCFVDSMADIAHAKVPDAFVAKVFAVMALAERHTFQVLTKRPGRLRSLLGSDAFVVEVADQVRKLLGQGGSMHVGVGKVASWAARPDAMPWPLPNVWLGTSAIELDRYVWRADVLRQTPASVHFLSCEPLLGPLPSLDLTGIDWVIAGGESGPGHRPLELDWVRDLRDRCVQMHVALFFKQVGGRTPKAGGRLLDGRTWDEFPTPVAVGGGAGG